MIFTVVATDNGLPLPFNSTATVNITVSPADNFFSPELDQPSYSATLAEDNGIGTLVLQFTVSDSDRGRASEIGQIIFLGTDSQFFTAVRMGPNSGEIRSK